MTRINVFLAAYYRTSIKKARKIARDDMEREVSVNLLETDFETVGWINLFLERFWVIFEPALAAQVMAQVDTILHEKTPGFVDVRLNQFTLGTKAPRVEGIKVYNRSAPDVVVSFIIKKKHNTKFFFDSVWIGKYLLSLTIYKI
jgi:Ca2+-dependent lipid-binding protein